MGFRFTSHGCSLSGASAEFAPFGYSLWRLAGMVNAVTRLTAKCGELHGLSEGG